MSNAKMDYSALRPSRRKNLSLALIFHITRFNRSTCKVLGLITRDEISPEHKEIGDAR